MPVTVEQGDRNEIENRLNTIEAELASMKITLDIIQDYLTRIQPWMHDVTNALQKLGECPGGTRDLGF